MPWWKNKILFGVGISALMICLFSALAYWKVFETLQVSLADRFYGDAKFSKRIAIIEIDDKSLDEKEGLGPMGNWSRETYAKLLEILNKYEPKVIAFDIFFRTPRDNEGDEKFKDALEKSKNPIIISCVLPV